LIIQNIEQILNIIPKKTKEKSFSIVAKIKLTIPAIEKSQKNAKKEEGIYITLKI